MIPITNFNLYTSADNVVLMYTGLDVQLELYFRLLRATGARANEGLQFFRWINKNETTITLIGEKKALPRYFSKENLPLNFVTAVERGINPFTFLSYTQMVRYLGRGLFYPIYYQSGRKLNAHLFRYVYIRKLIDSGKTVAQVKAELGKLPDSDVSMYYNRVFYKN